MAGDEESQKHKLKLKEFIGRGAFGDIRKGVYDKETVAVKTLSRPGNRSANEPSSRMFFREAQMLRSCRHNRIIGYKALVKLPATQPQSAEPVWALVMEFAKHGNLSQRIVRQMVHPNSRQYDTLQALSWALDVGSALEYLHLRTPAVLHRDVKSANIMITAEEGRLVAKLSDFGLHVTADSSRYTAQQSSSFSANAVAAAAANKPSQNPPQSTTVTVMAAAPSTSSTDAASRTPDSSNHTNASSSSAAIMPESSYQTAVPTKLLNQQSGNAEPPTSAVFGGTNDIYGEVHDSRGGSRVFFDSSNTAGRGAGWEAEQHRQQSYGGTGTSAGNAVVQRRRPAQRNNSFRRAAHHPPGEALPRLPSAAADPDRPARSGLDSEAAGDVNAVLFAQWRDQGGSSSTAGSVCSLATDGTWVTHGTGASGTDTAGSDCTDDTCGSIYDELETVFDMTGGTGSCLYMAPEVYLNQSYNEKSDVFSFGVVLYELMARTLVVFTELPQYNPDPSLPHKYAAKVAGGYRPSQPKCVPDTIWALISACWQQDPVMRPHMSEVVAVLSNALASAQAQQQAQNSKPRSTFSLGRRATVSQPAQAGTAAVCPKGAAEAAGAANSPEALGDNSMDNSCNGSLRKQAAKGEQDEEPARASPQGCGCVIC